jgi:AcrR family transcriptional regulator
VTSQRIRLSPDTRREQLLELGVRLLATRPLEQLSIDLLAEEAGISRGLLYHYFGNKQDFHEAVVRRATEELFALTEPVDDPDPFVRLAASLDSYVAYVETNRQGYLSLVQAAYAGNEAMREIYDNARAALTDRIFEYAEPTVLEAFGIEDSPGLRLLVRGWSAMVEHVVLAWVEDPRDIGRQPLIDSLSQALFHIMATAPKS